MLFERSNEEGCDVGECGMDVGVEKSTQGLAEKYNRKRPLVKHRRS
jgi:hypothetical protein